MNLQKSVNVRVKWTTVHNIALCTIVQLFTLLWHLHFFVRSLLFIIVYRKLNVVYKWDAVSGMLNFVKGKCMVSPGSKILSVECAMLSMQNGMLSMGKTMLSTWSVYFPRERLFCYHRKFNAESALLSTTSKILSTGSAMLSMVSVILSINYRVSQKTVPTLCFVNFSAPFTPKN